MKEVPVQASSPVSFITDVLARLFQIICIYQNQFRLLPKFSALMTKISSHSMLLAAFEKTAESDD